jgi:hypothetical protein
MQGWRQALRTILHRKHVDRSPVATASALKVLAHNDLLIQWPRPKTNRTLSYSKEEWQALRQWEPMLNRRDLEARERRRLMVLLREAMYPPVPAIITCDHRHSVQYPATETHPFIIEVD